MRSIFVSKWSLHLFIFCCIIYQLIQYCSTFISITWMWYRNIWNGKDTYTRYPPTLTPGLSISHGSRLSECDVASFPVPNVQKVDWVSAVSRFWFIYNPSMQCSHRNRQTSSRLPGRMPWHDHEWSSSLFRWVEFGGLHGLSDWVSGWVNELKRWNKWWMDTVRQTRPILIYVLSASTHLLTFSPFSTFTHFVYLYLRGMEIH